MSGTPGDRESGTVTGLSHVAIAVSDAEATAAAFVSVLGATRGTEELLDGGALRVVFLHLGPVVVELLEPKSPDHTCHYFSVGSSHGSCYGSEHLEDTPLTYGMVYLRSGEGSGRFVRPPEHDMERETRDRCLWCGEPDERK